MYNKNGALGRARLVQELSQTVSHVDPCPYKNGALQHNLAE